MNNLSLQYKNLIKIDFKSKWNYLIKDKIALFILLSMLLKNTLFFNVLSNNGAAKLSFRFDLIALINTYIAMIFILLFISFTFLLDRKLHLWSLLLFNLVYSIILVGDLWYYRGYNSFLSFHFLSETSNLNNLSSGLISMMRPVDLVFVIDNLVIIILALLFQRHYKNMDKSKGVFRLLFVTSFILILFFHIIYDYHVSGYKGPRLFKTAWDPYVTMRNLTPLGYQAYDSIMYINDHIPYEISTAEKEEIRNWFQQKNENLPDNKYKGIFQGKNLIILQVESLENFVINQKYENQEITPNLNKMTKNSLYFTNYYEQTYNGNSSDADLMTNAAVYPIRRGSTFFRFPNNSYNTLPKLFKDIGYTSSALHPGYGYYWNVANALTNFGFDKFKDLDSFDRKEVFGLGLTDECFLSQTYDIISKEKQPFYSFAVTATSHMPFKMPDNFKNLKLSEEFDKTHMGRYFQSVNYADKQIGMFVEELDKKGLLDNTVIAIYGDHTGVHKYYNDEVSKIEPQESWWKADYKIPLIIYSKNLEGEEIKTIGGQIDILPTLSYSFGIESDKYEDTSLGRNLLNTKRNFALLSDGTIVGKESLSSEEEEMINQAFNISDKIIRSNNGVRPLGKYVN